MIAELYSKPTYDRPGYHFLGTRQKQGLYGVGRNFGKCDQSTEEQKLKLWPPL